MPSSPSKSPPAHTWLSFRAGPCADRLIGPGFDLGSYGITAQVDDMEAARTRLGYDRIDLLGESAGTRTVIIYSWRWPDSIHRSVMIGVNPPGHFLCYPGTTEEQIDRYAALCAKDDGCRARTNDLSASLRQANAEIRTASFPADQEGQGAHRLVLRTDGIKRGGDTIRRPDDHRHVALVG
jgi:pimeloyl-ACP methyl ester carboxylesterase